MVVAVMGRSCDPAFLLTRLEQHCHMRGRLPSSEVEVEKLVLSMVMVTLSFSTPNSGIDYLRVQTYIFTSSVRSVFCFFSCDVLISSRPPLRI